MTDIQISQQNLKVCRRKGTVIGELQGWLKRARGRNSLGKSLTYHFLERGRNADSRSLAP